MLGSVGFVAGYTFGDVMRLDKQLSHLQYGSRKEVRELIKHKHVAVDGVIQTDPGFDVKTATIAVDGEVVAGALDVTYLLNKPQNVITATEDAHQATVLDLIATADRRPNLSPVGRLDKDTTGLLLLTTDGQLAHRLLDPKKHVPKTYRVQLRESLTDTAQKVLEHGITFKDFTSQPAQVERLTPDAMQIALTIHEGKFHQVKRMLLAVDNEVMQLERIAMGGLALPEDLAPGQYRAVTDDELAQLTAK